MRRSVPILTFAALVSCLGLALLSAGSGEDYSYSNGQIVDQKTGQTVDDLSNYDAICLVGKSPFLSTSLFQCAHIAGECPPLSAEGGILLARDGKCSFFAIGNMRVMAEYDYACSRKPRQLSVVQSNDVKYLIFADDIDSNDVSLSNCASSTERSKSL